jgi:hypothetical protein
MNSFLTSMVTVLTAIIGVAIVAVLVSRNAQTPQVLNSFWGGFSGALQTATGPVTGGQGPATLTNNSFAGQSGLSSLAGTFLSPSLANMA